MHRINIQVDNDVIFSGKKLILKKKQQQQQRKKRLLKKTIPDEGYI